MRPLKTASGRELALERDVFRSGLERLARTLLHGPGVVAADERHAAACAEPRSDAIGDYLAKVRNAAYRVTDEEVAALRESGCSDDALFELTVTTAFGAAEHRLAAGLAALDAAYAQPSSTEEKG